MVGVGGRTYVTRCHVCRRRKVKCDGRKPTCMRCEKANLTCTGYERSLDYLFFNGKAMPKDERLMLKTAAAALQDPCRILERKQDGVVSLMRGGSSAIISPTHEAYQNLVAPQYKTGFVSVFQDRYVPDLLKPSNGRSNGICAGWIATACELSSLQGSGMLSDSLLAMSLALVGGERQDQDISTAGLRHYSKALSRLRTELQDGPLALGQFQRDVTLVTCLACATYEMIAHQSFDSLVRHLQGIRALFTAWGVGNLNSTTSRRVFYEYRLIEMTVSLATRRASFLSLPQWLNPPWKSHDLQSSNPLQTLIDSAIHLPALVENWDTTQLSVQLAGIDNKIDIQVVKDFVHDALAIQRAINDWEADLRGRDNKSQLYIAHLADSQHSSEASSPWIFFYKFPNFEIAAALMYYETIHIFLYQFITEMIISTQTTNAFDSKYSSTPLQNFDIHDITAKSLECADRICQSLEYFFQRDMRMIGRIVILSPFEAVRSLFARLHQIGTGDVFQDIALAEKIRFCDMIAERIRAEGLLIWNGPGAT